MLLRPDDIVLTTAARCRPRSCIKAFAGADILYAETGQRAAPVAGAVAPQPRARRKIGIRLDVDHVVTFKTPSRRVLCSGNRRRSADHLRFMIQEPWLDELACAVLECRVPMAFVDDAPVCAPKPCKSRNARSPVYASTREHQRHATRRQTAVQPRFPG